MTEAELYNYKKHSQEYIQDDLQWEYACHYITRLDIYRIGKKQTHFTCPEFLCPKNELIGTIRRSVMKVIAKS